MANRFKDFDAAWAEKVSPELSVRVLGTTYTLPAALPAKVVLMLARMKAANSDPNADVPLDRVIELLEPFFGPGVLEQWANAGMDVNQMSDVFGWAMSVYQGGDPDAEAPSEASEGTEPNPNS